MLSGAKGIVRFVLTSRSGQKSPLLAVSSDASSRICHSTQFRHHRKHPGTTFRQISRLQSDVYQYHRDSDAYTIFQQ